MTSMDCPEGDLGVQATRVWCRVCDHPGRKEGCRHRWWYGLELQCHDAGRDVARFEKACQVLIVAKQAPTETVKSGLNRGNARPHVLLATI